MEKHIVTSISKKSFILNISFVESLKYVINQFRKIFKGSEKAREKKMNSENDFIENELEL